MTDQIIVIEGQSVPVATIASQIQVSQALAEMHAAFCNNLDNYPDGLPRTYAAAAFFSGNASSTLAQEVIDCLEIGNGDAVQIAIKMGGVINKQHKDFWAALQDSRSGEPLPVPDDLVGRRKALPSTLATAQERLTKLKAQVAALPIDHARKVLGEVVLKVLVKAEFGAAESVKCALGDFNLQLPEEQFSSIIAGAIEQLTDGGRMSEAEARQILDEKLGASDDEKKAAIIAQETAPLALESSGTQDGALLSAEQEIAALNTGIDLLNVALIDI
jgi:hypothetical protein